MIERFMILYDNKYLSRKWSYYFSNSNIEEFSYWKTKGGAEKRLQNQIDYFEKRQNERPEWKELLNNLKKAKVVKVNINLLTDN